MSEPSGPNQSILEWQNSFSAFGISYSGPKDGKINADFITAIVAVERKLNAFGQIFTGTGVRMSATDAQKKFLNQVQKTEPAPAAEPTSSVPKTESQDMKVWESFLSQNLPVVGSVYNGDLAAAGKTLEAAIGKSINKSLTGVIWNDAKKSFNTTPDDIKKALDLIATKSQTTGKKAEFLMDDRIAKLSRWLSEKK